MSESPYEGGRSFVTHLGCTVTVVDGFAHLPGMMLHLDMRQPGDKRHAEVHLSPEDVEALRGLLP